MSRVKHAHKHTWVDDLLDQVNDPFSWLNIIVNYVLWLLVTVVVTMIIVVLKEM